MRSVAILIAVVWVGLDVWLKAYTVASIPPYPGTVDVVPGFLSFTYIVNRGAAWSLFSGGTLYLTVLRAAVGVGIIAYLARGPRLTWLNAVALGLIAGGALANALDGLRNGYVVDTLLSHWLTAVYRLIVRDAAFFPIFNLADVGVVSGVILLLISGLFTPSRANDTKVGA